MRMKLAGPVRLAIIALAPTLTLTGYSGPEVMVRALRCLSR
jgi:hypothetical protein